MLALEDEARQVVSGGGHAGVLRLGSMESTAAARLPAILAAFHQRQPATRMQLQTGPSMPLLEQVRNGQLDCAFVALPADFGGVEALADLGLQRGLSGVNSSCWRCRLEHWQAVILIIWLFVRSRRFLRVHLPGCRRSVVGAARIR
ncbi:LysR substrate-binding domain-containing protein [Halopseudomonas pachastrellae]|nr:LysR substrate-binding domain-containing protein [Halopseudomonas pachastrellae]